MLSKLISSVIGFAWSQHKPETSLYLQAFVIGILPIWGEVLASFLSRIEPARQKDKKILMADAAIDALVFLLLPGYWFLKIISAHQLLFVFVLLFFLCGLWRIQKFLRTGLNNDGYFDGLPVTYTGYQWIVFVFLEKNNYILPIILILIGVSCAMVSNKRFIKASQ